MVNSSSARAVPANAGDGTLSARALRVERGILAAEVYASCAGFVLAILYCLLAA